MKVRQGFVSNSSSSSFVMLSSKEAFDRAYANISAIEQAGISGFIIEGVVGKTKVKGLSYGVDLNGEATEIYMNDDIQDFLDQHPEQREHYDNLSKVDNEFFLCWNILRRFKDEVITASKNLDEQIITAYEGRG